MKKRFEYKTVEVKSKSMWTNEVPTDEIDEILNKYGQEGWELHFRVYIPLKENFKYFCF